MKFSVVVPSVYRPKALAACLAGLSEQTFPPDEVVVVLREDDIEGRACLIDADRLSVTEARPVSPGYVGALSGGIAAATSDVVAFLDDDAVPTPHWLDVIRRGFADDRVGGVGGPIRNWVSGRRTGGDIGPGVHPAKLRWHGGLEWRLHDAPTSAFRCHTDMLPGSNMAYRRDLLPNDISDAFSSMAPSFELEFSLAAQQAGFDVVYDSECIVDHYPDERPRDMPSRGDAFAYDKAALWTRYLICSTYRSCLGSFLMVVLRLAVGRTPSGAPLGVSSLALASMHRRWEVARSALQLHGVVWRAWRAGRRRRAKSVRS